MKTPKLPTAAPRHVAAVLQEVLAADPQQEFTQQYFRDRGIGQFKQGLQLTRALDLLNSQRRLCDDVLECRGDGLRLRELLRTRLARACQRAGCSAAELGFLDREGLDRFELTQRLEALPPVRNETSDASRSNMLSCLRAIWEFLERLGRPTSQAGRNDLGIDGVESGGKRLGVGARQGVSERLPALRSLDRTVGSVAACEVVEIPVDFAEDGSPIYARVAFDLPVGQSHLRRLAKQLLKRAEAMKE